MDNSTTIGDTQLDPKVVKVMRALKQVESGGDYNAVGDNGQSHGAYQFNKNNFKTWAGQYLGDENAPMTPANQNKLMYYRIKEQKDAGLQPDEIAAIHNGAHKDENGNYVYNAPEYGDKFRKALSQGQTDNQNPTFYGEKKAPETPVDSQDESIGTKLSNRAQDASKALAEASTGKINPISGVLQTVGAGAGALGDVAESGLNFLTGGLLRKGEKALGEHVIKPLAETGVGKAITSGVGSFAQAHPELSADIGAVGNIASAVPVIGGVKLAGSLAKKGLESAFSGATENAIKKELTSAAMRTIGGKKALAEVGDEGLSILSKKELAPIIDETGKYTEDSLKNSYDKIGDQISHIEDNELQPLLKKVSTTGVDTRVPIEDLRSQAMSDIKNEFKAGGNVGKAESEVNRVFDDYKGSYGDYVTLEDINDMKRGIRKTINFNSPKLESDVTYHIGQTLQKNIEDNATKLGLGDVGEINKRMAALIKAQKFLEKVSNKKVQQGFIRKTLTNSKGMTKGLIKKGAKSVVNGALIGTGITGVEGLLGK